FQNPLEAGDAMHQFVVDRSGDARREIWRILLGIIQKNRGRSVIADDRLGNPVQLAGAYARANRLTQRLMRAGNNPPGFAHNGKFFRRFQVNTHYSSRRLQCPLTACGFPQCYWWHQWSALIPDAASDSSQSPGWFELDTHPPVCGWPLAYHRRA